MVWDSSSSIYIPLTYLHPMAPKLAAMQIRLSLLFACLTLADCVTFGRDDPRPANPTPEDLAR